MFACSADVSGTLALVAQSIRDFLGDLAADLGICSLILFLILIGWFNRG